jgi:hypothetical protein
MNPEGWEAQHEEADGMECGSIFLGDTIVDT